MFEGKLVRLRALTREDLPRCVSWINEQEMAQYLEFHRPVSLEQEQKWYEGLLRSAASSKRVSCAKLDTKMDAISTSWSWVF